MLIDGFSPLCTQIMPMQPDFIAIGMDDDGALPGDIEKAFEERKKSGKPLPKV